MSRHLVTGVYGFIGCAVAQRLLNDGHEVVGVDRLPGIMAIKQQRAKVLEGMDRFEFYNLSLVDHEAVNEFMWSNRFDAVLHFAGQYSVKHSNTSARSYVDGNIRGYINILEACRLTNVERFLYASSSWADPESAGRSLYGASKVFNELAGSTYTKLFNMTTIGLRYSSVYGPWMRPDTGPFQIARKLLRGKPIKVAPAFDYKVGYVDIDDAVEATVRFLTADIPARQAVVDVVSPFERANMTDVLRALEECSGRQAKLDGLVPVQQYGGEPDVSVMQQLVDFTPRNHLKDSMAAFWRWYSDHAADLS